MIEYLYDPADVADLLSEMPALAGALSRARSRDSHSAAFRGLMKSPREVYRLLTNARGYPALGEILRSLDSCMTAGWTEPKLMKTRSQSDFESHLAAVAVAETFRQQGHQLHNPDADVALRGDSRCDVIATRSAEERPPVSVEVVRPIALPALHYFIEDLRLLVLHIDTRGAYEFAMRVDATGGGYRVPILDNYAINHRLEDRRVPGELLERFESAHRSFLGMKMPAFKVSLTEPGVGVQVSLEVHSIDYADDEATRGGVIWHPSSSGVAPEGVFAGLCRKAVRSKLLAEQAVAEGHLAVLVVDLSRYELILSELGHAWYFESFAETIAEEVVPYLGRWDAVLFTIPRQYVDGGLDDIPFAVLGERVTVGDVEEWFGGPRSLNAANGALYRDSSGVRRGQPLD